MASLDDQRRAAERDPQDLDAALAMLAARARIEGLRPYWELFETAPRWSSLSQAAQENVAQAIAQLLPAPWSFVGLRVWACDVLTLEWPDGRRQWGVEPRQERRRAENRLMTLRHQACGLDFQVIPGRPHKNESFNLKPLLLSRWPMTRRAWALARGEEIPERPDHPRTEIDFQDVLKFCADQGLRLPTDPEWDYACWAGVKADFFMGDILDERYVWGARNSLNADGVCESQSVLLHEKDEAWNSFGLVDMLGNVREWCDNEYARGGCYDNYNFISADRRRLIGPGGSLTFGFRPAATLPGLAS